MITKYIAALLTVFISLSGSITYAELLPHKHFHDDGSYSWVRESILDDATCLYSLSFDKDRKFLTAVWMGLEASIGAVAGVGVNYYLNRTRGFNKLAMAALKGAALGAAFALYDNPATWVNFYRQSGGAAYNQNEMIHIII